MADAAYVKGRIGVAVTPAAYARMKEHQRGDMNWEPMIDRLPSGHVVVWLDRAVKAKLDSLDVDPSVAIIASTGGGG